MIKPRRREKRKGRTAYSSFPPWGRAVSFSDKSSFCRVVRPLLPVPTLRVYNFVGVSEIGAGTGAPPLQRMKQPCPLGGGRGSRGVGVVGSSFASLAPSRFVESYSILSGIDRPSYHNPDRTFNPANISVQVVSHRHLSRWRSVN